LLLFTNAVIGPLSATDAAYKAKATSMPYKQLLRNLNICVRNKAERRRASPIDVDFVSNATKRTVDYRKVDTNPNAVPKPLLMVLVGPLGDNGRQHLECIPCRLGATARQIGKGTNPNILWRGL
jgi:hypothetical protein